MGGVGRMKASISSVERGENGDGKGCEMSRSMLACVNSLK